MRRQIKGKEMEIASRINIDFCEIKPKKQTLFELRRRGTYQSAISHILDEGLLMHGDKINLTACQLLAQGLQRIRHESNQGDFAIKNLRVLYEQHPISYGLTLFFGRYIRNDYGVSKADHIDVYVQYLIDAVPVDINASEAMLGATTLIHSDFKRGVVLGRFLRLCQDKILAGRITAGATSDIINPNKRAEVITTAWSRMKKYDHILFFSALAFESRRITLAGPEIPYADFLYTEEAKELTFRMIDANWKDHTNASIFSEIKQLLSPLEQ